MFKIVNSEMECLVVVDTIEEARQIIADLKKKGQYSWDIFECSEMPKRWVETPEARKEREDWERAYAEKHASYNALLDRRNNRDAKPDYEDRENAVRHFWGLE